MKKKKVEKLIEDIIIDESFLFTMEQLFVRLQELSLMQEEGKTNYTGEDLNILEAIQERIANETITEKDIFEVERLAFKFL